MDSERPLPDDWHPGPRVAGNGGVEIATWDLGGQGAPLVLLHATGVHARMWLPLAPSLRATHRLWAVDQRAHGRSGHRPDGDYRDWSHFVDDFLAVVDALDLVDASGGLFAAGHSLGGAVLLLAEQRRPGLLRAAYCYEPVMIPPAARTGMREENRLARMAVKRRGGFASRQAARDNYASKPPFATFAPEALDAYVEHAFTDRADGTVDLACLPAEEATVYEGATEHDAWEHLATTTVPVTLASSAGNDVLAAAVPVAATLLPRATVLRYDGLTHFGPMEDPGRVGADMAAALSP